MTCNVCSHDCTITGLTFYEKLTISWKRTIIEYFSRLFLERDKYSFYKLCEFGTHTQAEKHARNHARTQRERERERFVSFISSSFKACKIRNSKNRQVVDIALIRACVVCEVMKHYLVISTCHSYSIISNTPSLFKYRRKKVYLQHWKYI